MKILIAEDERITRRSLQRQLESWGHDVVSAEDGQEALEKFQVGEFDIVVTDWEMPRLDGKELTRQIRELANARYVYLVMLTGRSDQADIIAGMEAGADDYLRKPFDKDELRVRLRAGERVIELERRLASQNQMLQHANEQMRRDLDTGAAYVESIIPAPETEPVHIDWRYVPSSDLGGDTIGYHWIDSQHLAIYLIDVTGHGLDSALHSVSITNVLRAGSLPSVDMRNPDQVMKSLNQVFQGHRHGKKFFTIWYGVYNTTTRALNWSGGGHPPSLLLCPGQDPALLDSSGPIMGALEDIDFPSASCIVQPGSRLIVFSDGVFEILRDGRLVWKLPSLYEFFTQRRNSRTNLMDPVLMHIQTLKGDSHFDDDVSIIEARFS